MNETGALQRVWPRLECVQTCEDPIGRLSVPVVPEKELERERRRRRRAEEENEVLWSVVRMLAGAMTAVSVIVALI